MNDSVCPDCAKYGYSPRCSMCGDIYDQAYLDEMKAREISSGV